MRGKACSAEFMRRLKRMVEAHGDNRRDLVKAITHQTCLKPTTVYQLLQVLELEEKVLCTQKISDDDRPHPTLLQRALGAVDPVAMVGKAVEEGWTAEQVDQDHRLSARPGSFEEMRGPPGLLGHPLRACRGRTPRRIRSPPRPPGGGVVVAFR